LILLRWIVYRWLWYEVKADGFSGSVRDLYFKGCFEMMVHINPNTFFSFFVLV